MFAAPSPAESSWELEWTAPAHYANGTSLPPGAITGYKIYQKTEAGYQLHSSTADTKIQVPAGTFAVAASFSGGQTGLSDPVTLPTWDSLLAKPDASNTVSPANTRFEIQAKIDALKPGQVLYLRGGEYKYTESGTMFDINSSGQDGNYVTIRNYPGEKPVLTGIGWANENDVPTVSQKLLTISGDYVRVFGLKVHWSGGSGISINGNFCHVEECESCNNYFTNINCGGDSMPGRNVVGGTILYCKAHHSRIGNGIFLVCDDKENYNVDGWTIRRCLSFRNGFNEDNRINFFGGGNSDGVGCTKYAHDNYTFNFDWVENGRANRIRDFHVIQNILYNNADDGADTSSGEGTLFAGNFSAGNGPSGTKGFKQFRPHYETSSYLGNVAIGSKSRIYPDHTLYIVATSSTSLKSGDIVLGENSKTEGKVESAFMFSNGNPKQVWSAEERGVVYLIDTNGVFEPGEKLLVGGIDLAKVTLAVGQTVGCDHRVHSGGESLKPLGRNNEIAWTTIWHSPQVDGSYRGLSSGTAIERGGDAINNLSTKNQDHDILRNFSESNNILNVSNSIPEVENPNYTFEEPLLSGDTIQQQWRNLYREIQSNLMPVKDGNLYCKGQLHEEYYHSTAADDPLKPSDPEDHRKLKWFRSGKTSDAPDIGAFQHESVFPPNLIVTKSPKPTKPTGIDFDH
jgi:hypothetical protein